MRDGDVIAFDRARLECRIAAQTLAIRIERLVTAGDTAPPDLDELARDRSRTADARDHADRVQARRCDQRAAAGAASSRTATIGLRTGAALLAIVAWFAFTAKSVALDIQPTPASVSLPSTLFKLNLGDRFLLRPGSHRVAAELPGYYPLDTEIEVGSLSDQTIALTLTKLPGS